MGSQTRDAFEHPVWTTLRLLDTYLPLSEEQLATAVPGTYGSIIETMRHLVGADPRDLLDMTGDAARRIEEDEMDLRTLRGAMETDREACAKVRTDERRARS